MALDAGWTLASAVTLDRFCGSGITSVNLAAAYIMSGMMIYALRWREMMSYTATLTSERNNRTVAAIFT